MSEKEIQSYRIARAALAINYALGQQNVFADINLNKVAKYVLEVMDNMDMPLNGLTEWSEFKAGLKN